MVYIKWIMFLLKLMLCSATMTYLVYGALFLTVTYHGLWYLAGLMVILVSLHEPLVGWVTKDLKENNV